MVYQHIILRYFSNYGKRTYFKKNVLTIFICVTVFILILDNIWLHIIFFLLNDFLGLDAIIILIVLIIIFIELYLRIFLLGILPIFHISRTNHCRKSHVNKNCHFPISVSHKLCSHQKGLKRPFSKKKGQKWVKTSQMAVFQGLQRLYLRAMVLIR